MGRGGQCFSKSPGKYHRIVCRNAACRYTSKAGRTLALNSREVRKHMLAIKFQSSSTLLHNFMNPILLWLIGMQRLQDLEEPFLYTMTASWLMMNFLSASIPEFSFS